jgi:hypothetical protein
METPAQGLYELLERSWELLQQKLRGETIVTDQSREKEAKGERTAARPAGAFGLPPPRVGERRCVKRRGWDLNPRATFRPPAVFKTAPFDRSGTPPDPIVAEAGFPRLRSNSRGTVPAEGCPRNGCWDAPFGASPWKGRRGLTEN